MECDGTLKKMPTAAVVIEYDVPRFNGTRSDSTGRKEHITNTTIKKPNVMVNASQKRKNVAKYSAGKVTVEPNGVDYSIHSLPGAKSRENTLDCSGNSKAISVRSGTRTVDENGANNILNKCNQPACGTGISNVENNMSVPDRLQNCAADSEESTDIPGSLTVLNNLSRSNVTMSKTLALKLNELPPKHVQTANSYRCKANIRQKTFSKEIKCFKCEYCPQMTLRKNMMDIHKKSEGACAHLSNQIKCPGCANVFRSETSFRVHLQYDHNLLRRDVAVIVRNLHRVQLVQQESAPSCAYAVGEHVPLHRDSYASETLQLTLQDEHNQIADLSQERSSCAKRSTLLESYLDGISSKDGGTNTPRLTESGPDLLENTFNFTTPVIEQLPSIQAEHNTGDVDTALIGETNAITLSEGQMLVDVRQHPVQEGYIITHPEHNNSQCLDHSVNRQNILVAASEHINGNQQAMDQRLETPRSHQFLGAFAEDRRVVDQERHTQDYLCISPNIPVINLDDKPVEEFDLSSYTNDPPRTVNNSAQPTTDENDLSEEKKAEIKKLGVGFRCNINGCKFRMQSEENIKYHRRCHEGKLYNCPQCCKDCPTWISLSSHLWQAHKIDMELYKCDLCAYRTPSYSRLTGIHRGIHGSLRPYLCDDCGKGFKTVKQMRNHKNIHRAKMVRLSHCFCSICGRTVADKRLLTQHINTCHNKKKPFLCSICGYATGFKHSLLVHIRKHTGEKPHACDKCEYKTADHNALRRHKMKHSGSRNYKCSHCSYTCIQSSTYKAHIKLKHPSIEAELIFSCVECNYQSLQRGKYLTHIADHRQSKLNDGAFYQEAVGLSTIMSDRVVETIAHLSGTPSLLTDEYYEVERLDED